jgi:malonyl-CoA O-methyltransferase
MLIDKNKVKTTFGNAAPDYDAAAIVQQEILIRLLEKLETLAVKGNRVLDIGSGTGLATGKLRAISGAEMLVSLDLALPMLQFAKQKQSDARLFSICSDAEALPFKENSFDLIFSASTFQWCNDIGLVFDECLRLLRPGGLFVFSTFGPDTLYELRACFDRAEMNHRVNSFIDMHLLGDGLLQQGFSEPVMEVDRIQLLYEEPAQLLRDLKLVGATNNSQERSRGLLSRRKLHQVLNFYNEFILPNKKYPASYEVIYGHAWKHDKRDQNTNSASSWQPIVFK